MNEPSSLPLKPLPEGVVDDEGRVLGPEAIALELLISSQEIRRFAASVAELAQMDCAVMLHDPDAPRFLQVEGDVDFVLAPISQALCKSDTACRRRIPYLHEAAQAAMVSGKPATCNGALGKNTLFACPICLHHDGAQHPKAAVVAAVQDIFHFDYADRLAELCDIAVLEAQNLMCETDQRSLNAAQLRRIRTIIDTQTQSYSAQISERYAQLRATALTLQQKEELSHAYDMLDSECRAIGHIQRNLVPSVHPTLPGYTIASHYTPARRAGGDYFDFFPRPDGSLGILVADVSGHGPSAAVVMAMLRAIFHTYPKPLPSPINLFTYANRYLGKNIMGDQFATAVFVVLDPKDGRLSFSSAGHESPLLLRPDTCSVQPMEVEAGYPLGVVERAEFTMSEAQLDPGAVLLMHTDGITEAFSPSGQIFGKERLIQTVCGHTAEEAAVLCDSVMAEVRRFSNDVIEDDQTLVVIKRQ